jgi:HEAT repeat protein
VTAGPVEPDPPSEAGRAPKTRASAASRATVQFFLVPLLVVAVAVGLFFFFALLTREHRTAADDLAQVRAGSANERWQAAFDLAREVVRLPEGPEKRRLAAESLDVFTHLNLSRPEEREVRRYMALVLGRLGDPAALPALRQAAQDPDTVTRLYSIWALGMLHDAGAVALVVRASSSEDEGERKMAAYVLGKLGDPASSERLRVLLGDRACDVRWNAAVALAEMHDRAGAVILHTMLDRSALRRQAPGIRPSQEEDAILSALQAVSLLADRDAIEAVDRLASSDPSLKVRDAALKARAAIRP